MLTMENLEKTKKYYKELNKITVIFKKEYVVYTYNRIIIQSYKIKEILPFVITWLDLEDIMLNEISQTWKEKYYMMTLTCGI